MKQHNISNITLISLAIVSGLWLLSSVSNGSVKHTDNDMVNNSKKALQLVGENVSNIIPHSGVTEPSPPPPLVQSARKQIGVTVSYDPSYVKLEYPMGDVPQHTGVCTDVIIRAYRQQGKDLQALVRKDMKKVWSKYPKIWGLKTTDKNIDHRRVPNLKVFFRRHGTSLKVSDNPRDYKAGDLVTWKVLGRPHIGIVSSKINKKNVPLIIHNIGRGTQEENLLFKYPITGHYRY